MFVKRKKLDFRFCCVKFAKRKKMCFQIIFLLVPRPQISGPLFLFTLNFHPLGIFSTWYNTRVKTESLSLIFLIFSLIKISSRVIKNLTETLYKRETVRQIMREKRNKWKKNEDLWRIRRKVLSGEVSGYESLREKTIALKGAIER